MNYYMKTLIIVIASFLGLSACGGGGGSTSPNTGPSLANFQGTYLGAYQVATGAYSYTSYDLGVDVNANGGIIALRRNGVAQGLTGTLSKDHGNIFAFTLSDNTSGGFFADDTALHVAFLDQYGSFGVLQKGANVLPTYTRADLVGSWQGYTVELNSSMNITKEGASSVIVTSNYTFSGQNINGAFTGDFALLYDPRGWFIGNWSSTSGTGTVSAWMSADKTFVATWACPGTVNNITIPICSFSAWHKV